MNMSEIQAVLAAAIVAADAAAKAGVSLAIESVPHVTCTRCSGKGRVHIADHLDSGTCFKCGGSRKQPARGHGKALKVLLHEVELNRLRSIWRATKVALDSARVLPAPGPEASRSERYQYRRFASNLEKDLARVETAGKVAKAHGPR